MQLYHGTNAVFKKFDKAKSRIINDYYGGGVAYFTDDKEVAKSYAASVSKRGGDPIIYDVNVVFNKVFDVDKTYTGKDLTVLLPSNLDDFARGVGLLKYGSDKFAVINNLKNGNISLTGDQIFKGLSRGMINTSAAREHLIKLGYDGLRYNGGLLTKMKHHNVFISYDANKIKIKDRQLLPTKLN